jgi:hypothetical protein
LLELATAAVRKFRASDCAALSSPFLVYSELRDGDGGQNTDDRDDDHQLDQGKAFLQLLHVGTPSGECNGQSVDISSIKFRARGLKARKSVTFPHAAPINLRHIPSPN